MKKAYQDDNLKQQIIEVAWEMFEKKGYDNTTVSEIIKAAGTSKGGFYYYFKAKEELLMSLYYIFDREYKKFYEQLDKSQNTIQQLVQVNQYIFYYIEGNVGAEILSNMYIAQLSSKGKKNFWGEDRYYNKMIKEIVQEGQKRGEIRSDMSGDELMHHILELERGILIDWCVKNGNFSVGYYGRNHLERYLEFLNPQKMQ